MLRAGIVNTETQELGRRPPTGRERGARGGGVQVPRIRKYTARTIAPTPPRNPHRAATT